MRRCILSFVLVLSVHYHGTAQELDLPHLELLQGLREREYFDLALEYIQKIEKTKLPPEVTALLPLETARARIGLALQQRHGAERETKILEAQGDLEKFLQANPQHPNLAEARAELAQLFFQQGRFLLFQAKLREDRQQADDVSKLVKAATPMLDRAEQLYAQALPRLKQNSDAPLRNQSIRARAEKRRAFVTYIYALWYEAHTLYEIARRPQADDRVAANSLYKANELLAELAKVREQHPLGWAAIAFSGKCYEGVDDLKSADAYRRVLAERNLRAQLGQELARYYRLQVAWEAFRKGSREAGKFLRSEGENWVKTYPGSLRTRHGQHVRYMLALVQAADYQALEENRRAAPMHRETIERATRTLEELERSAGDIAWAAEQMLLPVMQLSGHAAGSLESLRTFKECLLRADSIWTRLGQTSRQLSQAKEEEKAPLRQQAEKQAAELLAAARRALRLMPRDVKDSDWDLTYQMLIVGHLRTGDTYRAAVLSDYLAHHARQTDAGLKATVEAMKIYQRLARTPDPIAQERVLALADRLQTQFPTAPQTDEAREVLGRDFLARQQYPEAVKVLAKVTPKHPNYAVCYYWAGSANWVMHYQRMRTEQKPLRTPSPEREQAVRLLEQSVQAFAAAKAPPDPKQALAAQILLAEIYGVLGETDRMLSLLSPLLSSLEANQLPPDLEPDTEPRILGLALRGYVEKKDFQRGVMRVFTILQSRGGKGEGYARLLRSMGMQLRTQLVELHKAGPAAQTELMALREGFRQLLQTVESNPQLLGELRGWVADSYAALGDFRKALDLYQAIPQRQPPEELQLLRLLRQAWETVAAPEKTTWLTQWDQHMVRVGAGAWARRNPYYLQESILLLEAQGKISGPEGAVKRWYDFRNLLRPFADPKHKDSTPALRQLFHESSFHFFSCLVREAKQLPEGPERDAALARAATEFLHARRANFGQPEFRPQYEKLVEVDPELKAKVEELGK